MSLELISAIAAVVASVVAAISLLLESRRSRFQSGVELLLRFNDIFSDVDMRKSRKYAAEEFKKNNPEGAEEILDFFETIALLVRQGAISELFVWHSFYVWIDPYFALCKGFIDASRKEDSTIYSDLVWLHKRLQRVEKKKRHCTDLELIQSKKDLEDFIDGELELEE